MTNRPRRIVISFFLSIIVLCRADLEDDLDYAYDRGDVIISTCDAFTRAFSEASANLTSCLILHSRPLTLCSKCITPYTEMMDAYESIMKGQTFSKSGEKCGEEILNSDTVHVTVQTAQFFNKIWSECNCKGCFAYVEDMNGTVVYDFTNNTKTFNNLVNVTLECFEHHMQVNATKPAAACKACHHVYKPLNDFYIMWEKKSFPVRLCMDVVDKMNSTRNKWSKVMQCTQNKDIFLGAIYLASVFGLLPILFYLGIFLAEWCKDRRTQGRLPALNFEDESSSDVGLLDDQ